MLSSAIDISRFAERRDVRLKTNHSGVSLLEMVMIVGIISIVSTVGIDSYRTNVAKNLLKSDLERLTGLTDFARGEAQRTSCVTTLQVGKDPSNTAGLRATVTLVADSNPGCILSQASSDPTARNSSVVRTQSLSHSLFTAGSSLTKTFSTPSGVITDLSSGDTLALKSSTVQDITMSVQFSINGTATIVGS